MAEHEFDKKEAQLLIQELMCYLKVLNGYCEKYYRYEDFDAILIVLKYILKISAQLHVVLDARQVVNINHK
ncbi:TPA: hypothetical protein IAD41_00395 [Candidatus Scatenecus faecavium]|uniref:Uncharacterized protein n=1 Tax=Candidatus Scatenecus faecavium TaxID=2840915 RepID=A0A9D1K3G7_9BACT|nr:hypothetical protein [Candidatus Scatenecus faecavium]